MAPAAKSEPPKPAESRHKVVRFGARYASGDGEEEKLYRYLHQRADLKVSQGSIPADFLSKVLLPEGHPIFLETRAGGRDERGGPVGPLYQVSWKEEKEVIATGDAWNPNLDDLWIAVLSHFERKNLLSDETLDELDADPFVLFGIDDRITQEALRKLEQFPALTCEENIPSFEEWCSYLRVDIDDSQLHWLVRAFSETELPKPWTSYKGVGSIVCYIRADTGEVTWKHPFYDYFKQLRDFCRQASVEEVMQVRCNRLLWSYEATRVETDHDHEPLISPEYVSRMADIFGYDIKTEGYLVRNLKAQLKVFARCYREKQDIDISSVEACAELLAQDVEKLFEMRDHWENRAREEVQFDLNLLANGDIQCVNCQTVALSFCLECKDYLCLGCYDALHQKGQRLHHAPFRLVPCSLCVTMPAKLQCTFTDRALCHECYALRHIKMLPPDGKENQPRRINYTEQYARYARFARERAAALPAPPPAAEDGDSYESVLSADWHPFYDARGVKYFYNFSTGERMRQTPQAVPSSDDPGVEGLPGVPDVTMHAGPHEPALSATRSVLGSTAGANSGFMSATGFPAGASLSSTKPLQLTGYEKLRTEPASAVEAAMLPDKRTLRPPHRVHMPNEVYAG